MPDPTTRDRPVILGNWKMHKTPAEAEALAGAVVAGTAGLAVDVGLAPAYPALLSVGAAVRGSRVRLVGQDAHFEPQGAFTGAVSARMLAACGCSLVLVGHSERRLHFGDTDAVVRRKLDAVLAAGMAPVLCVGETLVQREAGAADSVVREQLEAGLAALDAEDRERVLVAYEPVWAIGTGRTATAETAEAMHRVLRRAAAVIAGEATAARLSILYGGSVKGDNVAEILAGANVDGVLVGGASLESGSFLDICRNAA